MYNDRWLNMYLSYIFSVEQRIRSNPISIDRAKWEKSKSNSQSLKNWKRNKHGWILTNDRIKSKKLKFDVKEVWFSILFFAFSIFSDFSVSLAFNFFLRYNLRHSHLDVELQPSKNWTRQQDELQYQLIIIQGRKSIDQMSRKFFKYRFFTVTVVSLQFLSR